MGSWSDPVWSVSSAASSAAQAALPHRDPGRHGVAAAGGLHRCPRSRRATARPRVVLLEARPDRVPVFQDMSPNRPFPVQLAILASRSLAETVVESLPKASLQELLETSYQADPLQLADQRLPGLARHRAAGARTRSVGPWPSSSGRG